jgi:hypothetical protein
MYKIHSLLVIILVFSFQILSSQNTKQEQMRKLEFMVGNWVGVSKGFENGKVIREEPAFEKIAYKVDKHIITIDLHSESLQLHTVLYFDENEDLYYYNPFYKNGAGKYKAYFENGMLVVKPSAEKRFIFKPTEDGGFQEYGEERIDGKWIKYFEDTFIRVD